MATNQVPILPAPPRPPPSGWTMEYGNELNRWLTSVSQILTGFTYGRFNGLFLATTFPTSGYGLRAGEVFANDGILTVVQENDIWLGSLSATCTVGTLTVTV